MRGYLKLWGRESGALLVRWLNWDDGNDDISNQFMIQVKNGTTSQKYYNETKGRATHGIARGDWFALMFSFDWSASGVGGDAHIWTHKVGDASAVNIANTPITDYAGTHTVGFVSGPIDIGYSASTAEAIFSECEFYFDGPDSFVDWSDSAVRAKFVDGAGKPVGLGATGQLLTGSTAKFYFPDGDATNNLGEAGDFTEVGTIVGASSSPSD